MRKVLLMELLLVSLVFGQSISAAAQEDEIGSVADVHPVVLEIPLGQPSRELEKGDAVFRGTKISLTEEDSFLRILLYDQSERVYTKGDFTLGGAATLRGRSEATFSAPQGATTLSNILLHFGKLVLALPTGGVQSIVIKTPEASIPVNGTYLRVLAAPEVGTFVAVDEGAVTVKADAGGEPVEVTAGQWVLVPPGGLPTRPSSQGAGGDPFDDSPLLDCCDFRTGPPEPPFP